MIVNRVPRWMLVVAHASFVLGLSTPAYSATIDSLDSNRIVMAWYYRAGVAALCLLSAAAIMMLPGILAFTAFWIAKHVRRRPAGRG